MSIRRMAAAITALVLVTSACVEAGDQAGGGDDLLDADTGDCIVIDMAVSSEKIDLLDDLARTFNESGAEVDGECVFIRPQVKASGGAMQSLAAGWNETVDGPRPVIWSPAGSAWGAVLNERLDEEGLPPMTTEGEPFMLTPLVIAMPEPMAQALGWPEEPLGWADIFEFARSGAGWADFGHEEWGPFRLGKTNPNFSTSGLSALIAQTYAATGKSSGLSIEDLENPDVIEYARSIESTVVHYGTTTLTFLNNWYRADQRGTALTYASAAAVEEKSVIDYNLGNPDGTLEPGEEPRPPRIPLVAIYPEEGTLFSDNPFFILDAEWVDENERAGAVLFSEYVQQPDVQQRVLEFGFRPGNPSVAVGAPIVAANGVDPTQPQNLLPVPAPEVMVGLLDQWAEVRKPARILLLLDVSGSMGEVGDPETFATKLDLAIGAAIRALDQVKDGDQMALWTFTTDMVPRDPAGTADYDINVPYAEIGEGSRADLQSALSVQFPQNGTPLYTAVGAAYEAAQESYDPTAINAVIVLTDGRNEDLDPDDDRDQLEQLLSNLSSNSEGQQSRPVRVFTIAYGEDADTSVLRRIAEASNAATYDASDPASIDRVFTNVISNF